jgi:hypothetical protein
MMSSMTVSDDDEFNDIPSHLQVCLHGKTGHASARLRTKQYTIPHDGMMGIPKGIRIMCEYGNMQHPESGHVTKCTLLGYCEHDTVC